MEYQCHRVFIRINMEVMNAFHQVGVLQMIITFNSRIIPNVPKIVVKSAAITMTSQLLKNPAYSQKGRSDSVGSSGS